jgi:hypothetical protein
MKKYPPETGGSLEGDNCHNQNEMSKLLQKIAYDYSERIVKNNF